MAVEVSVDLTKLYLARFSGDEEWYRAVPKSPVDAEGKVGKKKVFIICRDLELGD